MNYPLLFVKLLIRTRIARHMPSIKRLTRGAGGFLQYYSNRILTSPYLDLQQSLDFLADNGADAIDLGLGAPRFDLVPSGSTKLPADRRGLPPFWGVPELRTAIADKLQQDQHVSAISTDEVLVTHGGTGAFHLALDTFVNTGDHVIVLDPAPPLYTLSLKHRRVRVSWLPTWMENGRTRFRLEGFAKAIRRAKLVIINSPANPTGGIIASEDLEQIAWWANRRDVLILSDEVLERFRYDFQPVSIATLAHARRRTITIGSLSKGHALEAARVGWLAGHRHLVRPCALSAAFSAPYVSTLSQQVALAALKEGTEGFERIRREFDSKRHYAFERLQAMGLKPAWPGGGFFFWLPVNEFGVNGKDFAAQLFQSHRVFLQPGDYFGPKGRYHVRLSYAIEDGRLREGLGRLADFVGGFGQLRLSQRAA